MCVCKYKGYNGYLNSEMENYDIIRIENGGLGV